ncbi:P2X purinoceptor 7-like [Sebastes umbrosus]|uniref:P2X purinoceptor 7-like n=1 Tax=Sebastes umbrosus TaxID=72105 RepID=UPI00189F845D|nr:P2X purinoceptor 7-like [Sebastes umbrosus]
MTTAMNMTVQFDPESNTDSNYEEEEAPAAAALPPRMQQDISQWCTCGNCAKMPTEPENICCWETQQVKRRMEQLPDNISCMIQHPGLDPVCLNLFTMQNAYNVYRAEYGALHQRAIERQYRYLAYRSFVSWCWGFLGRRIRVVIPACVVLRIRREFPDALARYEG